MTFASERDPPAETTTVMISTSCDTRDRRGTPARSHRHIALALAWVATLIATQAHGYDLERDPDLAMHAASGRVYYGPSGTPVGTCTPEQGAVIALTSAQVLCAGSVDMTNNSSNGSTFALAFGSPDDGAPRAFARARGAATSFRSYFAYAVGALEYSFVLRETLLGLTLPPPEVTRVVPVRIPYALIWGLSATQGQSFARLDIDARSQLQHPISFSNIARVRACTGESCPTGSSGASGTVVGIHTEWLQVGGLPLQIRFAADVDCLTPSAGLGQPLRYAECAAEATAGGGQPPEPPGAVKSTTIPAGWPQIDPSFVPPAEWGIPPGADLNDYFRVEFSRNLDPDYVFDGQFE